MPIIRKKGSPFWYYDFRFGGKRYRGSTETTVKAAARTIESGLLNTLRTEGELVSKESRSPLLRDYLPTFSASIAANQHLAGKTKKYYAAGANLLMKCPLKDVALDRITTSIVAAVEFPHSASTGNNAIRTLSRALSHAVEIGLLRAAPRLHQYAESARDQVFTPDFEARLLAVAPQPLHDVFCILMDTGMRPDECYRLAWEDVLWTDNLIRIPDGKTRAARRTIGISARVRDILTTRAKVQGDNSRWVFPSWKRPGQHIGTVNKSFVQARRAAKLPNRLVLYATRHTFGTDIMAATGNQKLTMKTMGHVDVKTSARYQHPETAQVGSIIDLRNEQRKSVTTSGKNGHTFGHTRHSVQ